MAANYSLEDVTTWWGIRQHGPYQAMLLDFIEHQARQLPAQLPQPETQADWLRHAAQLRARLLHSLGLPYLPSHVSLNAQTMGHLERPGCVIEKISYETLPGCRVAAHLYLPLHTDGPRPAVLYAAGHWMENGKLEPDIQTCCANLARLGCAVLVYDPIGQGERLGDWLDHGHLEPLLVGVSQTGLMVWESMRAVDYLASRPEVDAGRMGMTGASGGGLNTMYTCALDSRIQAGVTVCYPTTFYLAMTAVRDRNWEDGVDLCNQVPEVMAYAEMSDILGLVAPRPLRLVAGQRDWMFPIEGTRQIYQRLQHIYRLLAAPERVDLVEIDSEHGFGQPMRQAAYGWLARWLLGQGDGSPLPERTVDPLPAPYPAALTYIAPPDPAELPVLRQRRHFPTATPADCFVYGAAPRPGPAITALTCQLAGPLPPSPALPDDAAQWAGQRAALQQEVRAVLGPLPARPLVRDRTFNQVLHGGLFAERVVFESEPGIQVPAMFLAPAAWQEHVPAVVYVDEWGKQAGLANGIVQALLEARLAVLAIDVRGVGETAATDFEATTNALMTDRPLFGQRVWDVLRALDYLWRRIYIGVQIDKGRIGCLGRGAAGLWALYAAALDERLAASVVWQAPVSYHSLIVEWPGFPASVYVFDVLHHFDLPQLMAAVAPRPLLVADAVDGERQPVSKEEVTTLCRWPAAVYQLLQTGQDAWQVLADGDGGTSPQTIAAWLKEHL